MGKHTKGHAGKLAHAFEVQAGTAGAEHLATGWTRTAGGKERPRANAPTVRELRQRATAAAKRRGKAARAGRKATRRGTRGRRGAVPLSLLVAFVVVWALGMWAAVRLASTERAAAAAARELATCRTRAPVRVTMHVNGETYETPEGLEAAAALLREKQGEAAAGTLYAVPDSVARRARVRADAGPRA